MRYTLKGQKDTFEVTIGCEIHAQVASNAKLFSRSATKFGAAQNSQVSLFDIASPGKLPVINKQAVVAAVKTGLAMNCQIHLKSIFKLHISELILSFHLLHQRKMMVLS